MERVRVVLAPQVEALRSERLAAGTRPLHELTVAEARAQDAPAVLSDPSSPAPLASIRDCSVAGPAGPLPVRIYRPEAAGDALPVLVFFSGGGWVLGSIETVDPVCRQLAHAVSCVVVSVGYRRAPEHPFPAAVDDCFAAVRAVAERAGEHGLDPRCIAVGGASAGANLAAVAAQLARDHGGPELALQVLVYPVTDYRADTPSMARNTDPVFFTRADMDWCWSHYLREERDGLDPRAAPLRASSFAGLPPALVITAEADPLRDEGRLYAERLMADGVPAELVDYEGLVHGFFSMTGVVDAAADAQERVADALRRAFRTRA